MNTSFDSRPDGFVHVWDFPDDPTEPCWNVAVNEAVTFASHLLGLDPETDFKIECQSVELREHPHNSCVGVNAILISGDKLLIASNQLENLAFLIEGFINGWFSAHEVAPETRKQDSTPTVEMVAPFMTDVHTEHCCLTHGCKYGDEFCTVTNKLLPQSFSCEWCDDVSNH